MINKQRLKVIQQHPTPILSKKQRQRIESQQRMERLWSDNPESFNPLNDPAEHLRIERSWDLIKSSMNLQGKKVVDLGCGWGILADRIAQAGAYVHAVDAATNAIERLKHKESEHLVLVHDCLPWTRLADNFYDLVIATDVIAYLQQQEYRMLFAEIARIMRRDGKVICSTPFDINTDEPLERFTTLAQSELNIIKWRFSHHALYMKTGAHYFKSKRALKFMEGICRSLWGNRGISHAIFLAERRPLEKI